MPDENQAERRWIVEPPPAAGEVSLYLALGDDVDLTDEQQAALGALLRSLEAHDAEVTGLDSSCPKDDITWCQPLQCSRVVCGTLVCWPLSKALGATASSGWSLMGSFAPRSS